MSLLLVEDDERVGRFVVRGLEAEGYSVAVACDAPKGFALARAEPFDVMILDLMLPGYSGRDLCQRLRAAGVGSPILMLTALDAVEDKVDGLRSGADDYLTKPFDFEELLARIEALLRRSKGTPAEPVRVLQAGDVTLDRESMTVRRQGKPVELTAKEFQLLELLMSSPGKVMSRTRILNKVWNYDSDPLTNVVDVYIRRLRTKLGLDPDRGLIRTLRGYGYKLDPVRPES
jgi:two-component system OmpR family response regulator